MEQDRDRLNPAATGEIDAVLALASSPGVPDGAVDRLMARVAATPQEHAPAPVIAFAPGRRPRAPFWRFAAALPLAASLALGLWLGANGKMDFLMPTAVTGGVVLNDDAPVDDLGGVGDAYAEEGTT